MNSSTSGALAEPRTRANNRFQRWKCYTLVQQLYLRQMKACGLAHCVCTICGLSNYLMVQKEAGPLRDLSLNPKEKQCFPSEKQQQEWEQLLIVYTSAVADKIRPDRHTNPAEWPSPCRPLSTAARPWTGSVGPVSEWGRMQLWTTVVICDKRHNVKSKELK